MRQSPITLCAAIIGVSLLVGPVAAAPDQTQGMALMSARVDEDGNLSLIDSTGAVSATRTGVGRYDVVFNRSIISCVAIGNTNGVNSAPLPATVSVGFDANPSAFDVRIQSADGAESDEDFQLFVFCPR